VNEAPGEPVKGRRQVGRNRCGGQNQEPQAGRRGIKRVAAGRRYRVAKGAGACMRV